MVPRESDRPLVMAPMPMVEGSDRAIPLPSPERIAADLAGSQNQLPADYAESDSRPWLGRGSRACRAAASRASAVHQVPKF